MEGTTTLTAVELAQINAVRDILQRVKDGTVEDHRGIAVRADQAKDALFRLLLELQVWNGEPITDDDLHNLHEGRGSQVSEQQLVFDLEGYVGPQLLGVWAGDYEDTVGYIDPGTGHTRYVWADCVTVSTVYVERGR